MTASKKDVLFVGLQLLLFGAYLLNITLFDLDLPNEVDFLHLVLAFLGIFIAGLGMLQLKGNLSPFPTPKKGGALITGGLFKYVRHPIYTGILIATFFLAFYFDSGYKLIIFLLMLFLFYHKSQYEEKELQQKFPEYESYKASTGRFFPRF